MLHRRDVRGNRFIDQEIDEQTLQAILDAASNSPSVGFSQPWEFVIIRDAQIKEDIARIFEQENAKASQLFKDIKAAQYSTLKLEGILATPINIAVFYTPSQTPVLGQTSMNKAGEYSVVCAIQNMWLMSRALNIGMGWVSILNADEVKSVLNAPADRELVAYLCLGHVDQFLERPELETLEWGKRKPMSAALIDDKYNS